MGKVKENENAMREIIATNIIRLRKAADLSQLSLAKLMGLTHNFVNDIENRKKGVSLETIGKLSKALGVEPYQFFLTPAQWASSEKYRIIGVIETLNKNVNRLFEYCIKDLSESKDGDKTTD